MPICGIGGERRSRQKAIGIVRACSAGRECQMYEVEVILKGNDGVREESLGVPLPGKMAKVVFDAIKMLIEAIFRGLDYDAIIKQEREGQ